MINWIWSVVSFILGLLVQILGINKDTIVDWYIKFIKKPVELSFKNDNFARITIRYRFQSIFYDLNNRYEDATIYNTIKLGNKIKLERPFDFDDFYNNGVELSTVQVTFKKLTKDYGDFLNNYLIGKCTGYNTNKEFLESAPFIDVEHIFYFYILEKLEGQDDNIKRFMSDNFYDDVNNKVFDPYKLIKKDSIKEDMTGKKGHSLILEGFDKISHLSENNYFTPQNTPNDLLEKTIILSLSSNSYDLSQLHSSGHYKENKETSDKYDTKGAADLISYLSKSDGNKKAHTVHFLVDNSGVEFFLDLILGYVLVHEKLTHLRINKIVYHVNVLPIFVSDVIENDFEHTLICIENCLKYMLDNNNISDNTYREYTAALAKLRDLRKENIIEIKPNFIWNMPTPYEDIKINYNHELYNEVFCNPDNLLIVKGDLNYRRLCRDMSWHYSKKLNDLTHYITTPTLVIRCFKSNVILDMDKNQIKKRNKDDREWRTNGKYGIIKFMSKK